MLIEDKTDQKLLQEVADLKVEIEEIKKDVDRDEITVIIVAGILFIVHLITMYNFY